MAVLLNVLHVEHLHISLPLYKDSSFWKHIHGLLMMEKLADPQSVQKMPAMYETSKWQNHELTLFLFFLFLENSLFHDNSVMVVDIAL